MEKMASFLPEDQRVRYLLYGVSAIAAWKFILGPLLVPLRRAVFTVVYADVAKEGGLLNADPMRKQLFEQVKNTADCATHPLKILEIGAGFGANLKYYPEGASVIFTDPNPAWKKYFPQYVKKSGHVNVEDMIVAPAESLPMVADGSVDAVVSTLVLCSVSDVDAVIREAKRILKPGGKFFFLEHVQADDKVGGSIVWLVQKLLRSPWGFILDSCQLDRPLWRNIKEAGFSQVELKKFSYMWGCWIWYPINPVISGYAVK